jgi:hypothetical protein
LSKNVNTSEQITEFYAVSEPIAGSNWISWKPFGVDRDHLSDVEKPFKKIVTI